MMHILVPLDGSRHAEYALGPAAQLARHTIPPTTVTLLRVETIMPMMISLVGMDVPYSPAPMTDRAECEHYLAALALHPILAGVTVEQRVAAGPTAEAICQQAQALSVDLIMMTSHGRSGLARATLGSVAETVVQHSHVPTMILRPDAPAFVASPTQDRLTILVPLDGSSRAETSLPSARMLAQAVGGTLLLLQVLSSLPEMLDEEREPVQQAKAYLEGLQHSLVAEGITATYRLAWGDPAAEICTTAQAEDCALIAMATHGCSGLAKMVLGSVATEVLRQTHRPMLIVNPLRHEAGASATHVGRTDNAGGDGAKHAQVTSI